MSSDLPQMAGHPVGDKEARKGFIFRSVWITIPGALALIGGAYAILPPMRGLEDASARLALAAKWLPIAMLPYAAVCLTIAGVRFFEGSHNPIAGGESETLKVHCRVMQNTLEQLVWFAICLFALAALVGPSEARVIPVLCGFFVFARLVYWYGYLQKGTLGRAPGVQLTFAVTVHMLLGAVVLLVRSLVT